jgi:hypothetical protein
MGSDRRSRSSTSEGALPPTHRPGAPSFRSLIAEGWDSISNTVMFSDRNSYVDGPAFDDVTLLAMQRTA